MDELSINTLRMLSLDMVENTRSGHPGLPLGGAAMVYALYSRIMHHNPLNPKWLNRNRFLLSAGHGSALLYSVLHLFGYGLTLEDLKKFRQAGSITPDHPEYGMTPGAEATTGPLGQGFAMGVGMAIAEKALADSYNTEEINIVDHYTYAFVSDGDLMEGLTSEAASLAGTLKLGKLIYLYDSNHISLQEPTKVAFTEDVQQRFDAYGWHTLRFDDGNDIAKLTEAMKQAQNTTDKPSLILARTHIGFGLPKQDTAAAHGEPLGEEALKGTKEFFDWPSEKSFYIPKEVAWHFERLQEEGKRKGAEWKKLFAEYRQKSPELAEQYEQDQAGKIKEKLWAGLPVFPVNEKPIATRSSSGKIIQVIAEHMPGCIEGSADLNPSTETYLSGQGDFGATDHAARKIHYGVREHAMGAITNGIALHGGLITYSVTFFAFFNYIKPAIRLAALMNAHAIFVFTHDSIGFGEDGPTHQSVEPLISARAVPNLTGIRPADANETAAAWYMAIARKNPTVLVLTRQNLPIFDAKKHGTFAGVSKGADTLFDCAEIPDLLLIDTGSGVHLAVEAYKQLAKQGIKARAVSMPSIEIFNEQDDAYKMSVIPPTVKKSLVIEAGSSVGWWKLAGDGGDVIGVDTFGESGPGKIVFERHGFTVENIVARALQLLGDNPAGSDENVLGLFIHYEETAG
ncbi:MAG: transketolase [Desulfobacterales bacterium]|nr:transketolase [Desulfobacterales bacterium]